LFACGFFILYPNKPVLAADKKISSNQGAGQPLALPPVPDHRSEITLRATDAGTGTITRDIKGQGQAEEDITADTITLNCGGNIVRTTHAQITPEADPDTGIISFGYTSFNFNQADIAAIVPAISSSAIWCTLNLPQPSITWTFPNGFRLDEVIPDVITQSNLITYPIVPLSGGRARVSWLFGDPQTPPDPDGDVSSCSDHTCNLTDQRFQYQFYSRKKTEAYTISITGSAGPTETSFSDDDALSTTDRFGKSADADQYCYTMRVQDTAGNFSGRATGMDEKCFVPDGKAPVFQSVHFYRDAAFTQAFPKDVVGKYTVTSNPCYFDPATCVRGVGNPRYIYLKLIFSEPLFGQFAGGYTTMADDGVDNDTDGLSDEETGGFNGLDDDADGFIDEDVSMTGCVVSPVVANDAVDNDCDGHVDEEAANGLDDDGDGQIDEDTWTGKGCAAKELWNHAQQACVKSPRLSISGPDVEGQVPYGAGNNGSDTILWECTAWSGNTNALCDGFATGTTIYSYRWEVSGESVSPVGLAEGDYTITLSQGIDGVGNELSSSSPQQGGMVRVDNEPPEVSLGYYKNVTLTTGYAAYDHDNNALTPSMPVVPEAKLYMKVTLNEYSGATPTISIYTPNDTTPTYTGVPQNANLVVVPTYTTCGQPTNCDPCTGNNCVQFDPDTSSPCMVFMACYEVASTTVYNGYAAVSVWARDRLNNMSWDPTNAHAQASQYDANGLSDDLNGDGYPTYTPASQEPDAQLSLGQYFAIDMIPPGTPSMGLPITPCDGTIARQGVTCSTAANTTNSPILTWKRLSNGLDDDNDGSTDEETYDFIDNDSDGMIDEDAVAPSTGTMSWEISTWRLQVSSDMNFATPTEYFYDNSNVTAANVMLTAIPDRPASAPYYWRVAAFDLAGNQGPWSPPDPKSYYTFGVDTTKPQITVTYFSDSARTTQLVTNKNGIPVTTDTASAGKKVYVTLTSDEPVAAAPTFKVRQNAVFAVPLTSTVANPANPIYSFLGEFEVDAIGGGATFVNGLADFLVTVADPYGNAHSDALPATGSRFFVDTEVPVISIITGEPSPASVDNDGDGIPGELGPVTGDPATSGDAVTITVRVTEDLREPFRVKVKQLNFPQIATIDDGIDNDCDGLIDEELQDGADNDADGLIDEDIGNSGIPQPGSGCLITMTRDASTEGLYTGYYNVFEGYDGAASIIVGAASASDPAYAADFAGNAVTGTGTFTVDTVPPGRPNLVMPSHDQRIGVNTPTLGWQVASRAPDLKKYHLQVATTTGFVAPLVVDIYQNDDGQSTSFFYTIPTESPLADGKYYWRVYAIDNANNTSQPSSVFSFTVDTLPPNPPKFDSVQNPTVLTTSPLSGTTEANASVDIYVNGLKKGTVTAGADGKFTVGIDDDKDGTKDEDPVDGVDNDLDGLKDEDPPGVFLAEGDNKIEGRVTDVAGNIGTKGCDPTTSFYDAAQQACIIVRDSGAPVFQVVYYSDTDLTTPLPFNQTANRYVAKEGTIYLKIVASEDLPSAPTYSINQQGVTDDLNKTATSIAGSTRNFKGTYTVKKANGGGYLDGDALVTAVGTDDQGNTTPDGTLPTSGAYFLIDTSPSTFKITYYQDSVLQEELTRDENLKPNAKAGNVYMLIIANEPQSSAPQITVDQAGSSDTVNAASTARQINGATSTLQFTYTYEVNEADGSNYQDGTANVSVAGTDLAGNNSLGIVPTQGPLFIIDTTAPDPPVINLSATTTIYTQMQMTGTAEAYSKVEIYVRGNKLMTADDGIDNDGDGLTDEEPANGRDDDNDMFADEDTTANTCTTGNYWDSIGGVCIPSPSQERRPDGRATTDPDGIFSSMVGGINIGKNLVYGRATDYAGNISDLSSPLDLLNEAPLNVELSHTFDAGWHMVGIPMQPVVGSPNTGMHVSDPIYRLQDGAYKTGSRLDPMKPGLCYWVYFGEETTVTLTGITSTTRTVNLEEGWNMVSVPHERETEWNDDIFVTFEGDSYDLGTAQAEEIVDSTIYFYTSATGVYSGGTDVDDAYMIQPWTGFVIKAHKDCTITFPYE
jgi:hypothetical protein